MCQVQLMTRFLLRELIAREEVVQEFQSQSHAVTTVRAQLEVVLLPFHGKH